MKYTKIIILILIFILYSISFFLPWIRMPLSKGLKISYFIFPYIKISFLKIEIFFLILCFICFILKKEYLIEKQITFLFVLTLFFFPLYCSCIDISTISKIFNEQREIQNLLTFISLLPPPPNKQYSPYFEYIPFNLSLYDRLFLCFKYISWGWLSNLFANILVISLLIKKNNFKKIFLYGFINISLFIIIISPYLKNEFFLYIAEQDFQKGNYQKAFNFYRKVENNNKEFLLLEDFFFRESFLKCYLFKKKKFCDLSEAKELCDQKKFIQAWDKIYLIKDNFQRFLAFKNFAAFVANNMGISWYAKGKGLSQAAFYWKQSLDNFPYQLDTLFYLSYAYLKLGKYSESLNMGKRFIKKSLDDTFNSYAYCFIGDDYFYLNDYKKARIAYEKAYIIDPFDNYLAMWKMTGS